MSERKGLDKAVKQLEQRKLAEAMREERVPPFLSETGEQSGASPPDKFSPDKFLAPRKFCNPKYLANLAVAGEELMANADHPNNPDYLSMVIGKHRDTVNAEITELWFATDQEEAEIAAANIVAVLAAALYPILTPAEDRAN